MPTIEVPDGSTITNTAPQSGLIEQPETGPSLPMTCGTAYPSTSIAMTNQI